MGDPKRRGIPKCGCRGGWGPQRVGDPNRGGAAMDGESLRVGDPKMWEQGWMGDPKEGMDGDPKIWVQGGMGIPKQGKSQTMGDLKG